MSNVESQITKYEQEIKAIKASFEQSAAEMPMYASQLEFTTSENEVDYYYSPSVNPLEWQTIISMPRLSQYVACGVEPIIVTFNCSGGINTFANIEIELIDGRAGLFVTTTRRLPYTGGAQWLVTVQPNVKQKPDGYYTWSPTKLRFVVKSAVSGTLGAKMIWE